MFDSSRRAFTFGLAASAAIAATPSLARAERRWSEAGLAALKKEARDLGVSGLVVRTGGKVILSDGDVSRPSRTASIRKSFVSALYGMLPPEQLRRDATMAELGIDDYTLLTDIEKKATVQQLLQARSGVYVPTAAETPAMKAARPPRGSAAPGTNWYYNNWDFNVAGDIYQRLSGHGLFTALEKQITIPLGFEDFDPLAHTRWAFDPSSPRFPAYNMLMSARDLAKFGQLFLDRGKWKRDQLVPEAWVAESTRSYSDTGRAGLMAGYGYMWWVTKGDGLPDGSYTAAGNGGRYITVLPGQDTVIAVQPDEKQGQPPVPLYAKQGAYDGLVRTLLAAWKG
ncbi:serine hydrolase domain-containing protein [Sphingoaurantiacus capsulatus]|uniref:Serine hydrolase domain-containing protein n=1 Tax=Sphingoaurantiacus capsulatus TaxID=1771310 RepID=A0ABV7X5X6_9SPHN